jgi:hypothetical protein
MPSFDETSKIPYIDVSDKLGENMDDEAQLPPSPHRSDSLKDWQIFHPITNSKD